MEAAMRLESIDLEATWQACQTIDDFCAATRMDRRDASNWAAGVRRRKRKLGMDDYLKKMPRLPRSKQPMGEQPMVLRLRQHNGTRPYEDTEDVSPKKQMPCASSANGYLVQRILGAWCIVKVNGKKLPQIVDAYADESRADWEARRLTEKEATEPQ